MISQNTLGLIAVPHQAEQCAKNENMSDTTADRVITNSPDANYKYYYVPFESLGPACHHNGSIMLMAATLPRKAKVRVKKSIKSLWYTPDVFCCCSVQLSVLMWSVITQLTVQCHWHHCCLQFSFDLEFSFFSLDFVRLGLSFCRLVGATNAGSSHEPACGVAWMGQVPGKHSLKCSL